MPNQKNHKIQIDSHPDEISFKFDKIPSELVPYINRESLDARVVIEARVGGGIAFTVSHRLLETHPDYVDPGTIESIDGIVTEPEQ